jgi:hypothetical protein
MVMSYKRRQMLQQPVLLQQHRLMQQHGLMQYAMTLPNHDRRLTLQPCSSLCL